MSKTLHKSITALSVMAVLVCCLTYSAVEAKSYRITQVDIDAQLRRDGNMEVTESRTYRFSGSFTYAYRYLPVGGPVAFKDLRVSEGGQSYRLSQSEEPGTFKIERAPDQITVTWFYRARDESRTFKFHYRASGAIQRHDDAAVLYYKFLSEVWTEPQWNISLRLKPPAPLPRDQINEWLHGPLWAESRIELDGTILAFCEQLPARRYLEIRALYPPEIFPGVEAGAGTVRDEIMAQEARWALEANRQRELAGQRMAAREKRMRLGMWIGIGLSLAGLLGWWQIYKRFHRMPPLPRFVEMTSEIPEKAPPALVAYLLSSRQVGGAALVGTMLDLARRGFVKLREERVEKKSLFGGVQQKAEYYWELHRSHREENASGLLDYENALLGFIFDDLAQGADSISIEEIKKKRSKFIKFFRAWKKDVEAHGKAKEWFDQHSVRGMYYSLALGGGMTALGFILLFIFGPLTLILAGAGMVVLVLSFFVPHRTADGETKVRHWKAVRKYLKKYEFRNTDRQSLLARVSDYLVYGVVLGLSTKFYRELAAHIPETAHAQYVPWYVYHGTGTGEFSPAAFGEAFSSMVSTTTSAMSTAAGTGGGASAGGGGGAGSGGGGAG